MNTTKFVELYKAAEKRAVPCVGGNKGQGGLAFQKADRAMLVSEMWELDTTPAQLGNKIYKEAGGTSPTVHIKRLEQFELQVSKGVIRLGGTPTGEHVGKTPVVEATFDGRIKTKQDIQPAFDRAAMQLIKLGITKPSDAVTYLTNGFERAKVAQKIDIKAKRIVDELRVGDLTKEQVLATLEVVKKSF